MALDPLTLGLSTAASAGGQLLKSKAANEDYKKQLELQQAQTANDIAEARARTAFGNDFLAGYNQRYGGLVDQNTANEAARLESRFGAIQPTVGAFAAPAQEAERGALETARYNAAKTAMGAPGSAAGIPLAPGMGANATGAEFNRRFGMADTAANDLAARRSALGSWEDIWNRNALREGETQRGLGLAEAMGKSKANVINQAVGTNNRSLSALPALQELTGVQTRKAPMTAPAPTNTSLAQILGGLGNLGGAIAGAGGFNAPNFAGYFTPPAGKSIVPRPSIFG